MTQNSDYSQPTSAQLLKRNLGATAILLISLFAGVIVVSYFYEQQLRALAEWIAQQFGLWGLSLLLFVSDTFVSPVPPDALLLIIAKSHFQSQWWWIVPMLGVISTLGGHVGWWLGRKLSHSKWTHWIFGKKVQVQQDFIKRYGALAVILGAATPVPFSVTCWSAGFLGMSWRTFALASLFRIPRFVVYYLVIHFSSFFL